MVDDNKELDAFFQGGASGEAEPAPPAVERDDAKPEAAPVESKAAPDPKPAPDDDDDAASLEAQEGDQLIPRRAYEDERKKRQDWKSEAVRAQTERDELRKQLEDAKRPQPQQVPQPQYQLRPRIDPREDPIGYMEQKAEEDRIERINFKLDASENQLRDKIGDEAVDALIKEAKAIEAERPGLFAAAQAQRNPYAWVHKQMESLRMQREIGTDPAAWREAERAKLRAELEAARGGEQEPAQAPRSVTAGMAPSLANVRSSAPRGAATWTGPRGLGDIVADIHQPRARR